MNVTLTYHPTAKQKLFHESTPDEVLYGGAAGGGKSYAICWDAFIRCMKYKGTKAYLFRRTFPIMPRHKAQWNRSSAISGK